MPRREMDFLQRKRTEAVFLKFDKRQSGYLFTAVFTICTFSVAASTVVMLSTVLYGLPNLFGKYMFFNKSPLIANCENSFLLAESVAPETVSSGDIIIYKNGETFAAGHFIKIFVDGETRRMAVTDGANPNSVRIFGDENFIGKVIYKNDLIGKIIVFINEYGYQMLLVAAIAVFIPLFFKG